jgi:hypothetical protein
VSLLVVEAALRVALEGNCLHVWMRGRAVTVKTRKAINKGLCSLTSFGVNSKWLEKEGKDLGSKLWLASLRNWRQ